ncbi:hypothetical protein PGT21_035715 [Puccinia graminis f. sp. tritici]|uniref:Uncharacterized protein n=1 Tax=Puccinia graminis f. sp. tritici TaxID=56615 RepID=A0A5B0MXG5_PUCGR|nr:hypothetical protein PGT21_035715 [Puccinia graminis f. sp. tritici]
MHFDDRFHNATSVTFISISVSSPWLNNEPATPFCRFHLGLPPEIYPDLILIDVIARHHVRKEEITFLRLALIDSVVHPLRYINIFGRAAR